MRVRAGVLHVAVEDGAWASQLGFFRGEMLQRLRARGASTLTDIVFRVGLPRGMPPVVIGHHADGQPYAVIAPTPDDRAAAEALAAQSAPFGEALARLYLAAAARRRDSAAH